MSEISIIVTKFVKDDRVVVRRAGSDDACFRFPKKGPIPHDVVHLFVEEALGLTRGFWGMVAEGVAPAAIQEIAKAAGHASARRATPPGSEIVELLQAERVVECFEADFWGAPANAMTFRGVVAVACESSHVKSPALDDATIDAIRARLAAFASAWMKAPVGEQFAFRYAPPA
jgi:hypothetical protein